jgi:undecaprenyl-diphosphatase
MVAFRTLVPRPAGERARHHPAERAVSGLSLWRVLVLASVQGLTELLPVSSSAHVVVAEKLMGLDPSAPAMTLLLVMLHAGTMLAVIVYFWTAWRHAFFASAAAFTRFARLLVLATAVTGVVGGALIAGIERLWFHHAPRADVELLFGRLELIAPALALAGVLILVAGLGERRSPPRATSDGGHTADDLGLDVRQAGLIGAVQGLCLPFRGFSRSGATISTAMLAGVPKMRAEAFSFALAVVLTPPVVIREALRLRSADQLDAARLGSAMLPSLLGAGCAFVVGLLALRWLSRWLEGGRWSWFGVYCLLAAGGVALLQRAGY